MDLNDIQISILNHHQFHAVFFLAMILATQNSCGLFGIRFLASHAVQDDVCQGVSALDRLHAKDVTKIL